MSQQIIKQPDGLYSVWSSIANDFIMIDATPDEIIEDRARCCREEQKRSVVRIVEALDEGGRPYYQFTLSYDDALKIIRGRG